jgi:uncharacterized protein (DUF1800 family)
MPSALDPIDPSQWGRAQARHLLNRAGFGVPYDAVDSLTRLGPAQAVGWFVDDEERPNPLPEPDWIGDPAEARERQRRMRRSAQTRMQNEAMSEAEREALRGEFRQTQAEIRRQQREDVERLKAWWLERMVRTTRPLEEKLTLFWHGHFATSAEKVRSPYANYDMNRLFRQGGRGNYKLLTYEVACSPAMMVYLDNALSRKESPNENWARELMELYTLGPGHYTEEDIKEAARAFTGWSTDGEDFDYRPGNHDGGVKTFMGRRGAFNGNDILDIIFEKPETAEFIAAKLWAYFAYEDPEPELRGELGRMLYGSGYDLRPFLRSVFLSRAFYSERAMGTRIKSPAELVVGLADLLEIQDDPLVKEYLLFSMSRMGQNLFHAPNVKGWPGGRHWINSGTLLTRYNASAFLVQGIVADASPGFRRMAVERYRGNRRFRREMAELSRRRREAQRPAAEREADMSMEMLPARMAGEDLEGPERIQLPEAPVDIRKFYAAYEGIELPEVAEALAERLYCVPLRGGQVLQIAQGLSGGKPLTAPFEPARWPEAPLRDTLHLMLSAAEFQLC